MRCALNCLVRHLLVLTIFLYGLVVTPINAGETASEGQLKAAYLVNFLKYIEWPTGRQTATICLFGRDNLSPYLASYEGKLVSGRELKIKRIASPELLAECQLLFISDAEEARFPAVLRWTDRQPILTVSDMENFAREGGSVALIRADGRLQFDINNDSLSRNNLKPSSQLMRLARQVIGGGK